MNKVTFNNKQKQQLFFVNVIINKNYKNDKNDATRIYEYIPTIAI